jgi:hypothetical protein
MTVRNIFSRGLIVTLVSVVAGMTGSAFADAPTPKWYDTIGLSGYMQSSYVGNLEDSPANKTNVGRQFDTNGNSFSLNTFLLQIAKPVGDSDHYGFTVRLRAGQDAAALNTATGSGGGNLAVQEAYMTYAATSKLQFIGGRFVTPEGFEGVDTVNNPNFSEGLLFTVMEPINHTGLKANYTFSDKVNATIGLVNGWNVDTDNNSQKTIMWQVATTPTKQITWSFQGLYGNEITQPQAVAASDHADTLSLDTVLGFNPTDKLSLNAQLNWRQTSNDPTVVTSDGGKAVGTTHASGAGLWASFATTSKFTEVARYEIVSDENGGHVFPGGPFFAPLEPAEPSAGTSTNQTVQEFTLTHKTMLTSSMGTRLEYRHDWSNEPSFVRSDGSAVRNQNTISADWFVTF